MRWPVLTPLTILCLASSLSLGTGLAATHPPDTLDAQTPPHVNVEAQELPVASDAGQGASGQPDKDKSETIPTTIINTTTIITNTTTTTIPTSLDELPQPPSGRSEGPGDTATPGRQAITRAGPATESFTVLQEHITTTTTPGQGTTTPGHVTTSPGNVTTTPGQVTTTPGQVTTPGQGTTPGQSTTARESGYLKVVMNPRLENGRVPTRFMQLVVCACPHPRPRDCRSFMDDLYIDGKDTQYLDYKKPVASLIVAVHNVTCEAEDHHFMTFSEGEFFFRERGDLVLRNVRRLEGLRVNDYCVDPRRDENGYMTWAVKACIPPPSVPRCCPPGEALKEGRCEPASTPDILKPPMSTGIGELPIEWPVIKNHYNPLNCTSPDKLTAIPLLSKSDSHLLTSPTGLVHIWFLNDRYLMRKYTYPPDLCVDGYIDSSGSVHYSANICYVPPEEQHRKVCEGDGGHICVRKCCKENEEASLSLFRCIPSTSNKSYSPDFNKPPNDYRMVYGNPFCTGHMQVNSSKLDERGRFHFNGNELMPTEYCVDKFSDGFGNVFHMAKVCIKEPLLWEKTRDGALNVCQIISLVFLALTVACNCAVPELLQGGGWYQLFHVLSLMLGYACMLSSTYFTTIWSTPTCMVMGFVLQFTFLAVFFWLNVLCFEVWRKIRSLNNLLAAAPVPIWAYLLYAFGVPAAIVVVTLCMQLYGPDGMVKPRMSTSRCFFENRVTHFLYFYGPILLLFLCNIAFITHTYLTYRKIEQNSSVLKKNSAETTATTQRTTEHTHRKRDYVSDFKQQFSLLVLMSFCWVTEVLSWLIPLGKLWLVTDLLNSLQGFFIFVIFIANRTKRRHLKRKFPLPFKLAHRLKKSVQQCCCQGKENTCLAPVNSFTSQISRKLSSSSLVSRLSTLSTSLKLSSVSVTLADDQNVKKPSVFEPEGGIIMLSHSSLGDLSRHDGGDAQS